MVPIDPTSEAAGDDAVGNAPATRERLRFTNFSFTRAPSGLCRASVELEWMDGDCYVGRSEGVASPLGDLRVCADATLRALEHFAHGELTFELIGVKTMRAFDENIVIVSVHASRDGTSHRLLGCHVAEKDSLRSAVVAVLHATNRMLGNFISMR